MRALLTSFIVPVTFRLTGTELLKAAQAVFIRHTGQDYVDPADYTPELRGALALLFAEQTRQARVSVYSDGTTEWEVVGPSGEERLKSFLHLAELEGGRSVSAGGPPLRQLPNRQTA